MFHFVSVPCYSSILLQVQFHILNCDDIWIQHNALGLVIVRTIRNYLKNGQFPNGAIV